LVFSVELVLPHNIPPDGETAEPGASNGCYSFAFFRERRKALLIPVPCDWLATLPVAIEAGGAHYPFPEKCGKTDVRVWRRNHIIFKEEGDRGSAVGTEVIVDSYTCVADRICGLTARQVGNARFTYCFLKVGVRTVIAL